IGDAYFAANNYVSAGLMCGWANGRTINTKAINGIFFHEGSNPFAVLGDDRRVRSVNVWQGDFLITQPARLLTGGVTPLYRAIRMVERLIIYKNQDGSVEK